MKCADQCIHFMTTYFYVVRWRKDSRGSDGSDSSESPVFEISLDRSECRSEYLQTLQKWCTRILNNYSTNARWI